MSVCLLSGGNSVSLETGARRVLWDQCDWSKRARRAPVRKTATEVTIRAALFCLCLVAVLVVMFVFSPGADAAPEYDKTTGADRYQTAVQLSQKGFAPGVEGVVIATGENYPDALSAGPLAAAYGGPVLLTHSATLDESTKAEITRLRPNKVFAVGLQPQVVAQLRAAFPEMDAAGGVVALVGTDRYDTARMVALEVQKRVGEVSGVVIVPGDSFADALTVAPLAAFKGWPILLTPGAGPLPAATTEALSSLGVRTGFVVGTWVDVAIADSNFTYVVGTDRYHTSSKVAELAIAEGMYHQALALTTGDDFPDALAAGPYLAREGGVLLLTRSITVPTQVGSFVVDKAESLARVSFIGLSPQLIAQVKLLLTSPGLPTDFTFATVAQGSGSVEVLWLEQRLTELTYRPGPMDGVFDHRTRQAVLAFQKWEGLPRDGVVGPATWSRLLTATPPFPRVKGSGSWVEVDKAKQVLLYVEAGVVARTLAVSTGSAAVGMITPSGTYNITRRSNQWDGPRYKPLYLRNFGVLAIHGYPSVPVWPASHGCVRVPTWDMDELFPLILVGARVHIY